MTAIARAVMMVVVMVTVIVSLVSDCVTKHACGHDACGSSSRINGLHGASIGIVCRHARRGRDDSGEDRYGF